MQNHRIPVSAYPFTLALIVLCTLISLGSGFGSQLESLKGLFITDFAITPEYLLYRKDLPEIQAGEIWRLFTPVLIHFGVIHLLFNMIWLWDLGRMIEIYEGRGWLLFWVFLFAITANLGQFYVTGPNFGGMSGVVYGFLGYLWMRGYLDAGYALKVSHDIMILMVIWFFVCLIGLVGNVANAAHGVGLVTGLLAGGLLALSGRNKA